VTTDLDSGERSPFYGNYSFINANLEWLKLVKIPSLPAVHT